MKTSMTLLVADRDRVEIGLLRSILRKFQLEIEGVDEGARAAALVEKRKFDGFIVVEGLTGFGELDLIRSIRASASNKLAPIVFIGPAQGAGTATGAFKAGATLLVSRPLNEDKITKVLSAMRGAMLAERRRYKRVLISVPVQFRKGVIRGKGNTVNLSRGGLLLESGDALQVGDNVELEFTLPRQKETVCVQGEVVRVDSEKRAGLRFTHLEPAEARSLEAFIGA